MNNEPAKRITRLQLIKSGNLEAPPVDDDVFEIALGKIELDPQQPRKDPGNLSDIADSIKLHGVLNPIIVRPATSGRYIVVAGERRYRAAKMAGKKNVLCLVRTLTEQQTAEIQLIENLHRKDLNPFEEAFGYTRLKEQHNYTDTQLAERMSRSRSTITETLGLLRIPDEIRAKCRSSDIKLSRDTLYLIARQPTPEKMLAVLRDAIGGVSHEVRRAKARTGQARESVAKKAKRVYHTELGVDVIVQGHGASLSLEKVERALEAALKEVRAERRK